MSDFTYAFEDRKTNLETYEWDNVWWEHAGTTDTPRVLYIGDSISCATRRHATEISGNTLFFDGFGTSKAVDNPYFAASLHLFAAQERERAVILFNNGLHGWHMDDEGAYREHYEALVQFLLKEFDGTPVVLLLTTAVADAERDARVVVRNRVVSSLAKTYGLPVLDLYSLTDAHRDLLSPDGVHLTQEGYRLLAKTLVDGVNAVLKKDCFAPDGSLGGEA